MRKSQQNLSNYERGDFQRISHKIVLNETIEDKDFSEINFEHIQFCSCNFKNTSFVGSDSCYLIFCNCRFNDVAFTRADFYDIIFRNCQFIDCNFISAELLEIRYENCKLYNINFSLAVLDDFQFKESQLVDVSFRASEGEDLIIQNSTLEDINCSYMNIVKIISKNDSIIRERVGIRDYPHFLREFVQNDFELLRSIMIFFTVVTTILYTFLKPELFSFFWQSKLENYIAIVY